MDAAEGKLTALRGRQLSPDDLTTMIENMRTAGGLLIAGTYHDQLKERMKKARIVRSPIASVDS